MIFYPTSIPKKNIRQAKKNDFFLDSAFPMMYVPNIDNSAAANPVGGRKEQIMLVIGFNGGTLVCCKTRKTAVRRCPEAAVIKKVQGGYACFATRTDYETWRRQK
jgi:hypothetical protein